MDSHPTGRRRWGCPSFASGSRAPRILAQAAVAERQTRRTQNSLPARACGFESHRPHSFRPGAPADVRGSTGSSVPNADTNQGVAAQPMPEHLVPMLARLSTLPPDDERWGYEIKWDGVRTVAYIPATGPAHLESRNLNDVTRQYPEAAAVASALEGRSAVLDGEVVAFDELGRPSFERLQGRMHLTGEAAIGARTRSNPIAYCIFDLMYLDGESLMRLSYTERRARLEELGLNGSSW